MFIYHAYRLGLITVVCFMIVVAGLTTGNMVARAENQISDLEYLNQDVKSADGVTLRQSEQEMGQAVSEFGDGGKPEYDKVVDQRTCAKRKVYGFFYDLANNPSEFRNFDTPNTELQKKADRFYKGVRLRTSLNPLKKDSSLAYSISYTTTKFTPTAEGDGADVEVLFSGRIQFTRLADEGRVGVVFEKRPITFRVAYQRSKCQLVATNFFEVVQKQADENQSSRLQFTIIFIVIGLVVAILGLLAVRFLFKRISRRISKR